MAWENPLKFICIYVAINKLLVYAVVKSNQLGQHIAACGETAEIFMSLVPGEFTPKSPAAICLKMPVKNCST